MSHCDPMTAQGSGDVHAYAHQAHRHGDLRDCDAHTTVENQSTVKVNGKLWAVKGDPNDHIQGELYNVVGSTVRINSIYVIVFPGDHANKDRRCGDDA